eukprot:gene17577-23902_t
MSPPGSARRAFAIPRYRADAAPEKLKKCSHLVLLSYKTSYYSPLQAAMQQITHQGDPQAVRVNVITCASCSTPHGGALIYPPTCCPFVPALLPVWGRPSEGELSLWLLGELY